MCCWGRGRERGLEGNVALSGSRKSHVPRCMIANGGTGKLRKLSAVVQPLWLPVSRDQLVAQALVRNGM